MKKKVLLIGPILTQSGYGVHARTVYHALKSREDLFDIYINPIPWGATSWLSEDNEERKEIDELVSKTYAHMRDRKPFDITVMVTIPTEWKEYRSAPINIGVCAGIEADRVSPHWLEAANLFVDKVIVTSEFSKETFAKTVWDVKSPEGHDIKLFLNKPIEAVNYPVQKQFLNPTDCIHEELQLKHDFNFLCVAQWGPRKNIYNTIQYFLSEFKDEDVGLVLKLTIKDGSNIDYYEAKRKIKNILNTYPDRTCSVHLLHGYMSREELASLYTHPKIKAMINFGHGEGYGLPLFEAAAVGLPIITHDWGGQKDFLYAPKKDKKGKTKTRPHFSKVSYELKPIQQEAVWDGVLQPESQWAFVHGGGCQIAMRQCYENYSLCQGHSKRLKKWILSNFTEEKIYDKFHSSISEFVQGAELEDWLTELSELSED